ncbi:MAG: hypothetical protein NC388_09750 [Clostridium sp.]|nr:hypothetical protein [Clostridium sp.]
MKKEMTIPVNLTSADKMAGLWALVCEGLKNSVFHNRLLLKLSCCYSRLLEERVSPLRTLRLLHAQVAFLSLVFPVVFSLPMRFLVLGWFIVAVSRCGRR